MKELSLFTGAGGGVYGSLLLGHRIFGYVEANKYRRSAIRQRVRDGIFDDAPIFNDVRTFSGVPYRNRLDLVTAGVPCQWISVAGKRRDPECPENLWPDTLRIIGEARPLFAFFENPPIITTHRYFGTILENLAALGYELPRPPIIVGADDFGAWHERKRAWFLAADTNRQCLWKQFGRREPRAPAVEFGIDGTERTSSDAHYSRELCTSGANGEGRGWTCDGAREAADACGERRESVLRTVATGAEFALPSFSPWWAAEPGVVRVVHGMANRRKRIAALGDGQVPICMAAAFRILVEGAS